jgi:hypothetical protein
MIEVIQNRSVQLSSPIRLDAGAILAFQLSAT